MNIEHWLKQNAENFDSPYEKIFVVTVLSKVDGLDFNTVSSQYHFHDLDGKNRYCDFVIHEGSIRIAIEIDGYDKSSAGQGMSHADFIDWQRRQAALTAQGWYVLRFANRDVRDEPQRCKRYIELLLRNQRNQSQHQAKLKEVIARLNHDLKVAESLAGAAEQVGSLQRQITLLKKQLELAQAAVPLSNSDQIELQKYISKLKQENRALIELHTKITEEKDQLTVSNTQLEQHKQILHGESKTMKTTIWAFTAIIGILITVGAYVFTNSWPTSQVASTMLAAPTCDAPIDWNQTKNHINQQIAAHGSVAEYHYMPNVKGSPTWISLGAKYPEKNRLSVVIWGEHRNKFGRTLSENLVDRNICVVGTVTLYKGTPQIELQWPRELVFR